MDTLWPDLLKILLAVVAGGLIGTEREFRDKAAGFRTLIFITLGSTMFTIFSLRLALNSDPERIASQVVTGVGFLGAGAILRDKGRVVGLTTASTIWLAAAIGMGIGASHLIFSSAVLAIVLIILWVFPLIEQRIDRIREERTYEVVCALEGHRSADLEALFAKSGLRGRSHCQIKEGGRMTFRWTAHGSPKAHAKWVDFLMSDKDILEFRY